MNYFRISPQALGQGARIPILKLGDSGEVFYELALCMFQEIERNNLAGRRTAVICPVGPVGQYPIFVRLVNESRLSLKNCYFFNMDEYLQDGDEWLDASDPLSFRGYMQREVYDKIDPGLVMPPAQRIFPDPKDTAALGMLLDSLGGADLCVGGIGINGHVAFNEPEPGMPEEKFRDLPVRALNISPETRAINAAGSLGGALHDMPRRCVTIGMREILGAKKIRLGCFRDWHRAVIRQAAYGEAGPHFPATLLQSHPDAMILVNENAAKQPY